RRRPPRDARADVEPRGPAPACDRDREELAVGRELVDRPAGDLRTEPEVVGEAPDGADAVGAGGDADELSDGVVGGERRPVPDVGWEHPRGEVVDALELGVTAGGGEVPGVEERLEGDLRRAPPPAPTVGALRVLRVDECLDLPAGERPVRGDDLVDGAQEAGVPPLEGDR